MQIVDKRKKVMVNCAGQRIRVIANSGGQKKWGANRGGETEGVADLRGNRGWCNRGRGGVASRAWEMGGRLPIVVKRWGVMYRARERDGRWPIVLEREKGELHIVEEREGRG